MEAKKLEEARAELREKTKWHHENARLMNSQPPEVIKAAKEEMYALIKKIDELKR